MASQQQPTLRWATLVVVIVAGAWTLFHLIWNFAGQKNDDYWGIALLILIVLALILAFVQFFQERSALQAASSAEQFPEPPVGKFFLASAGSAPLWPLPVLLLARLRLDRCRQVVVAGARVALETGSLVPTASRILVGSVLPRPDRKTVPLSSILPAWQR